MTRSMAAIFALALCACSSGANYKYVRVSEPLPRGAPFGTPGSDAAERDLAAAAASPACATYFAPRFKKAVLVVEDAGPAVFTVDVTPASCRIGRGAEPTPRPDLVIPLRLADTRNIAAALADGAVDESEAHMIHLRTFVPTVRAFFQVDPLFDERVASYMELPDFIHFALKNPRGYVYEGHPATVTATVLNVDGQWLVFEGAHGDPDVRIAVTVAESDKFGELFWKPIDPQDPAAARATLKAIKDFTNSLVDYRRKP